MNRAISHIFVVLFLAIFASAGHAHAEPGPDIEIDRPIVDRAGVLSSATTAALERRLHRHHEQSGVQLAVLTVETTGEMPIEDFSLAVAERWQGGDAERDDGMLFTLAIDDRENRIEVGYGLEEMVPDAVAATILRSLRPDLRNEDYDAAVTSAVDQLIALTGDGVAGAIARAHGGLTTTTIWYLLYFLFFGGLLVGASSQVWLTNTDNRLPALLVIFIFGMIVPALTGSFLTYIAHPSTALGYAVAWLAFFALGAIAGRHVLWLAFPVFLGGFTIISALALWLVVFDLQGIAIAPSLGLLTVAATYVSLVLLFGADEELLGESSGSWSSTSSSSSFSSSSSSSFSSSSSSSFSGGGGSFGGGGASGSW